MMSGLYVIVTRLGESVGDIYAMIRSARISPAETVRLAISTIIDMEELL
jgi:hypothetical protein